MNGGEHVPDGALPLQGDFDLWRLSVLRGAGFPVAKILRLACPDVAAAARAVLAEAALRDAAAEVAVEAIRTELARGDLESSAVNALGKARKKVRKGGVPVDTGTGADVGLQAFRDALARHGRAVAAFEASFAESRPRVSRALRDAASDPLFCEAVTWQNRSAVELGIRQLLNAREDDTSNPQRKRENMVVSYLHRYCTKNDTIGFFGPVGWATWRPEQCEAIAAASGPSLLAHRSVHFEQWAIDALAKKLDEDPSLLEWAAPRRHGFVQLTGVVARSPVSGKLELPELDALVLREANGIEAANALAARLVREHSSLVASTEQVYAVLRELAQKQLVAWTFEFRTTADPEIELRRRVERIGDGAAREKASAMLDEVEEKRRAVARAAGDVDGVRDSLYALDGTFTALTGAAATRLGGATYAGRTLVYEDTRRDFELALGRNILDALAPPLSLLLTSARWITFELARAFTTRLREAFHELRAKSGGGDIRLSDFLLRTQRFLHGSASRPLDVVQADLRRRWSAILEPRMDDRRCEYASADLRARVEASFAAPRAGWELGRHHAPDLMIAARSVDAIARGDWFAVLGELHVGLNTIDTCGFAMQHPDPSQIVTAVERDIRPPRVLLVPPKHSPLSSVVRLNRYSVGAGDLELEAGFEGSLLSPDRVIRTAEWTVEENGEELFARHEGRPPLPLLEVMGQMLSESVANSLDLLEEADHGPRVTIDRLVVQRESWRFLPSALDFAGVASESEGYLGAVRWAQQAGLPRFVFVRSELEMKPIFVDFESPLAVRLFRKIVRSAQEHVGVQKPLRISEMLPDMEDVWLFDANGDRYTSELRLVAVDRRA